MTRWVWGFVWAVCVAVFVARIVLAFETSWGTAEFATVLLVSILIVLLAWLLFMAEGLQIAALELRAADPDSLRAYAAEAKYGERDVTRVTSLARRLNKEDRDFAVGRELVAIVAVVTIALLYQALPIPDGVRKWIASIPLGEGVLLAMSVAVATLLPYWFSQLLPQLFADRHGVRFVLLPGAKLIANLCLGVARLRPGEPAEWTHAFFAPRLNFGAIERIRIGDRDLFEKLEAHYGAVIVERAVVISAGGVCNVGDRAKIAYSTSPRREVRYMVRAPGSAVNLRRWIVRLPEGREHYKPDVKAISVSTEEVQNSRNRTEPGENRKRDMAPEPLTEEFIFSVVVPLREPIPKAGVREEVVDLELSYDMNAFDPDIDGHEVFFVDITRPTRLLRLETVAEAGLSFREPQLRFVPFDEMTVFGKPDEMRSRDVAPKPTESGYVIEIEFPPIGSRLIVELDVRRKPV